MKLKMVIVCAVAFVTFGCSDAAKRTEPKSFSANLVFPKDKSQENPPNNLKILLSMAATVSPDAYEKSISLKLKDTEESATFTIDSGSSNERQVLLVANLKTASTYVLTISGLTSRSGSLLRSLSWEFSTAAEQDTQAPVIDLSRTSPPLGTIVGRKAVFYIAFNETINHLTVNADSIDVRRVVNNSTEQPLASSDYRFHMDEASNQLVIQPTVLLKYSTLTPLEEQSEYRITLKGIEDLAGNAMNDLRPAEERVLTYAVEMDTESDGMPDSWENAYADFATQACTWSTPTPAVPAPLNPNQNDAAADADEDGISNLEEFNLNTHPLCLDSDRDGVTDLAERDGNRNPAVNEAVVVGIVTELILSD